jgi:hypothetical protein
MVGVFFAAPAFFPKDFFMLLLNKTWLFFPTVAIVILLLTGEGRAESPIVRYDPATDRLSITAVQSSLQSLMQKIGAASKLSIIVSPASEETVTLSIVDLPLETGLKEVARTLRLNHLFLHETRGGQTRLASMRILPRRTAEETSPSGGTAIAPPVLTAVDKRRLAEEKTQERRDAFIQRQKERPEPQIPAKFQRRATSREDRRKRAEEKYQQQLADGLGKAKRRPALDNGIQIIPGSRGYEETQNAGGVPSTP